MSKVDTAPAAETENAEPASIADLVAERHQALPDHEAHKEVGEDPDDEPAPAAAVVAKTAPAPVAEAAPAAKVEGGDFDAMASDPKFQEWLQPRLPKFAREHIKTVNQTLAEARAEAERARAYVPPQPQPQRPAASAATTLPNPLEDPQGYYDAIVAQARQEARQEQQRSELVQNLRSSERWARRDAGNETFEDCKAWLSTKPQLENMFLQEPDPWGSALAYYQRERLTEEIGDDPDAFKKRIEDAAIAAYEARLAEQQQHIPARNPQMRSAPPAAASTARSAAPRDDSGRFAPAPLTSLTKNKFG
jgi:hypothetical protein